MDVDRVFVHAEVGKTDAHPVSGFNHQMINGGEYLAVEGKNVKVQHHGRIRPIGARMNRPFVQHDGEIPINLRAFRFLRMNDEKSHHSHCQLQHFIGMRMIHEGAVLPQRKFVNIGFTRTDMRLSEAADAVHSIGQKNAMPVNAGVLGQFVGHQNTNPIAFNRFDGRPRCLSIVTPAFHLHTGSKLALDGLGDQMKFFNTVFYLIRQHASVGRDHR